MSFAVFEAEIARINDILCAVNLLVWDSRTMMPPTAADARGKQIATLTGLARELATGDMMLRAIEGARKELDRVGAVDLKRRAVDEAAAAVATLSRVPADLIAAAAELKTRAAPIWAQARAARDFQRFAPVLERTLDLQREIACKIGYDEHPYDALCSMYEPGISWSKLELLYAELRTGIAPLLEAALAARPARTDILERSYPIDGQKAFSAKLAALMGYDFAGGRLDDTVHPFEMSFTRSDVRITGRFRENWLPGGLFAVWHEAGHGIYEQGISPDFTRSIFATDLVNLYAVGGASFGMHESQSRLWENHVGRSRPFWEKHFGDLRDQFPEQLADVSVGDFWRAVNAARPSLIRTEADELTYDLHIILRCEIEAALIDGSLAVRDVPAAWAGKMRAYLGLEVPDDALGALQDMHWSAGLVGAFPTYTIGNVMSSQLFGAARQVDEVERGFAEGNYAPLRVWLVENVHRHGRSLTPAEIIRRATGKELGTSDYLDDLGRKVATLVA